MSEEEATAPPPPSVEEAPVVNEAGVSSLEEPPATAKVAEPPLEEKKETDAAVAVQNSSVVNTVEASSCASVVTEPNSGEVSPPSSPNRPKDATTTNAELPVTPARATTSPTAPSASSGKGAQILMNRFQSLKERANQNAQTLFQKNPVLSTNAKAVQERAEQFWKQAAPKLQTAGVVPSAFRFDTTNANSSKVSLSSSSTHTASGETEKEADGEEEASNTTNAPGANTPEGGTQVQPSQFSLNDTEKVATATSSSSGIPQEASDAGEEEEEGTDRGSLLGGTMDASSRLRVGRALNRASFAATVAYESVLATGFRGRYNSTSSTVSSTDGGGGGEENNLTDTRPMPESQTEIILKSRVGQHMQEILEKLEPHEYAMLLGRGMLGVNLKQCYLKNHGVFVDFLVPGGQAESSGVVRSGDLPVRLGDIDLRKGTIIDIPKEIAQARRPVVLTMATGTKVPLERMNFVDVAVAMMHRARDFYNKRGTLSNLPSASSPNKGEEKVAMAIKSVSDVTVPPADTIDSFLTPPAPSLDIRREFVDEVPKRCLDKFLVEGLCQVQDMDSNFREAVRNAFLTCALDGRRLPFLSRQFSLCDEELDDADVKMTPSAQLMLFLELTSFLDLYGVTPKDRLREIASKITFKFFLPTTVGKKLQPPLFDFHHMVPDASLRHLELVLNAKTQTIPRDIFFDFSKAVVDSLTGAPFLSFLTSAECARMRAYLRNTAPYVNLPLKEMIDGLVGETNHAGAKNCFAYILLFLICQVEREPSGEHNFGEEPETKNRLLGASNDLCCAIFIRRTFLPTLQAAQTKLEQLADGQEMDAAVVEKVVKASEKFWSVFIAGTMELSSRRDESEACFNALSQELQKVASEVLRKEGGHDVAMNRATAEIFVKSQLAEKAATLADEMLYSYAANVNGKFREHKFHEWMCNELSKLRAKDPNWNSKQEIPYLPQGCVKRLLRKADLPEGVSSHKPFKKSPETVDQRNYQNAEFAVIFGSSVGNELANEMPVPGIESSDIRRYTCLPVALDREHEFDSFLAEDALPPTFEGYAIVPPQKPKPFASKSQSQHFSKDGWEISLVSFTIPNAESSGASSALYGVSLFFQCKPELVEIVQDRVDGFVHKDTSADASKDFQSPISLSKTETTESEGNVGELGKKGMVKNVSVSSHLPAFNDKHKSTSWVSRVLSEEYRDPLQPISIGLALVSRQNVILAMRDTLSRLLFDYAAGNANDSLGDCGVLVDVLGNFAYRDVESIALRCILEPYLRAASTPWIERPIGGQAEAFERLALQQVNQCLPPTPLALMFITALLEQKIILSSSRRSILQSATVALGALLEPLKWSHLLVPMVPASLAGDLIQYPAPFILGVPSEDAENAELIGNLPRDVSLVDLDVGRVILAPEFGMDNEMVRKSDDPRATASALRSQVLYLAQALGAVFGNSLNPESWLCDVAVPTGTQSSLDDRIEGLKSSARGFISELLEGVSACCYWVEEAAQTYGTGGEPTVLFDEDKFFEIKNHRATQAHQPLFPKETQAELALTLNNFDLVLESFLRCQSMSTYISSRPKTDMVYY